MTIDLAAISISFEAVKTSLNQNKDGIILRLAIHPNDVPTALIQDWVGSRYMVAMTRLGEDDTPEGSEYLVRANKAIQSAGMLCNNEKFQRFLVELGSAEEVSSDAAQKAVRELTKVVSRAEFRTDKAALERFEELRTAFENWLKQRSD